MSTPQHNPNQSLEEKLAAVNAAMNQQAAPAKTSAGQSMACPIDPAERALCEGCQ